MEEKEEEDSLHSSAKYCIRWGQGSEQNDLVEDVLAHCRRGKLD